MSETYSPAGNVSAQTYKRATVVEAATGTFGDEFMRQDMTQIADRIRFLSDLGYLTFPAVFSGQADPNTLDDYEEGTFTPSIQFGGAAVGVTYAWQIGRYTKIGNRVNFNIRIGLTSKGSSVGAVAINGLPFGANAAANNYSPLMLRAFSLAAGVNSVQGYSSPGLTQLNFEKFAAGAAANLVDTDVTNTTDLMISGHYDT